MKVVSDSVLQQVRFSKCQDTVLRQLRIEWQKQLWVNRSDTQRIGGEMRKSRAAYAIAERKVAIGAALVKPSVLNYGGLFFLSRDLVRVWLLGFFRRMSNHKQLTKI